MPIIQVNVFEGRTLEQKRAMVREMTRVVVETMDSPPEKVRIIIREMRREDMAVGGVLTSDA